jgi:hypothetical protein
VGRLHYALKDYENAIRAFDYATLIDDEFFERSWKKKLLSDLIDEEAIVKLQPHHRIRRPSYALLRINEN